MPQHRERMAILTRESDYRLADSTTIESAAKAAREHGERQGYIYDPELDYREAISSVEVPYMKRNVVQEMLRAAKQKRFSVLVCSEIRSISRRQVEVLVIYDQLQKYGVRLETVKEKFGEDAMSKVILSLRAMFVEIEVEQSKMRMDRGKIDRVLIGQAPVTVTPCYTHKLVDTEKEIKGKYVLNEEIVYTDDEEKDWTRIDVAKFFCGLLAKGSSLRQTCFTLNDMGIPASKGGLWTPTSLRGVVSNPIIYGQPYANRYMPVKKKTLQENGKYSHWEKLRPKEEWIPLPPCDPVISREMYDKIQFQIQLNKEESIRNSKLEDPGLVRAGYIFCSICGGRMSACPRSKSSFGKGNIYECRKRTGNKATGRQNHRMVVGMKKVDTAVKAKIAEAIAHPELVRANVADIRKKIKPPYDETEILETIANIDRQIQTFFELAKHATTADMVASLAQQMNDLENQKLSANRLLYVLEEDEEEKAALEAELVRFETWAEQVRPFLTDPEYLKTASYDELRLAVRILGIRVTVYPIGTVFADGEEKRFTVDVTVPEVMKKLHSDSGKLCPENPTAQ